MRMEKPHWQKGKRKMFNSMKKLEFLQRTILKKQQRLIVLFIVLQGRPVICSGLYVNTWFACFW